MKTNAAGIALIKEFEGSFYEWYPDPGYGWKKPTVGYGHTDDAGKPFYKDTKNKKFTKQEIHDILVNDLVKYERHVEKVVKAPLTENQFSALVSFCFNVGQGAFSGSTLLKKLNARDYQGAANEFGKWVNSNGKKMPGLVRRREAEKALFLKNSNIIKSPIKETPIKETPIKEPVIPSKPEGEKDPITKLIEFLFSLFK